MSTAFSEELWQHEIRKQGCPNDLGPLGIQKHQLAFEGPDMVTGPRERLAHSWPEKDRNSPCALLFVSDTGNRENPLSDS